MASKYKDIGKKQIIGVIEKLIQKVEAIEITLNLFIQYMDKDKKFDEFMQEKLGGMNETQGDVQTDRQEDSSDNKEDS
tara:strand:+ start:4467 stop:4700 length:234 start_codon:yes stop_codon:yes gene_type:complete